MFNIKDMERKELLNKIYVNSWSFDYHKFNEFYYRMNNFFNLNVIKTITLCGSNRFKSQIDMIEKSLVILGFSVFNFPNFHNEYLRLNNDDKIMLENILDDNHKRKIEKSDIVIIVNIDKYIGNSVKQELRFCKYMKKEIIYYEV